MTLLSVRDLSISYTMGSRRVPVLDDVTFDVHPGDILGIVGESGCGKSTLIQAVMRLLPSNATVGQGEIIYRGSNLLALGREEMRRIRGSEISLIFQDPYSTMNPVFRIGEQMLDAMRAHPDRRAGGEKEYARDAVHMLERVGIPDASKRFRQFPHELSGGMRQRTMIATASLLRPRLLLADEPTSALDVSLQAQIVELLKELRRQEESSIIFVSHDLSLLATLCNRVIVMYAGRIVEEGSAHTIVDEPLHPYTQALVAAIPSLQKDVETLATIPGTVPSPGMLPSGCKFRDRCLFAHDACVAPEPRLLAVGDRCVRCVLYEPGRQPPTDSNRRTISTAGARSNPIVAPRPQLSNNSFLLARDLRVQFGTGAAALDRILRRDRGVVRAVDGVDLDISRGEVVGLVGESGSGKSTLGRAILALCPLVSGRVCIDHMDIHSLRGRKQRQFRRRAQMIFQDLYSSLSPRLRVSSLLAEPYEIHRIPPRERKDIGELLQMVQLPASIGRRYPHEVSGGQARRIGIARALALQPQFLVADEPTSGLDVSVAAGVLNLLKELRGAFGLTLLIISHDLAAVSFIADRIAVMYLGQIVEIGPAQRLLKRPLHPYTRALIDTVPDPTKPHDAGKRKPLALPGEIPSAANPPPGCRFHTRCKFVEEECQHLPPALERTSEGREVACHFWRDIQRGSKRVTRQNGEDLVSLTTPEGRLTSDPPGLET